MDDGDPCTIGSLWVDDGDPCTMGVCGWMMVIRVLWGYVGG